MTVTAPDLLLRAYSVTVDGFMPIIYYAATPGQARSQAFRQYLSAFGNCTFHRFLTLSTVHRCEPEPGFGEPIHVEGEPAFRVPINEGHYVGFVRPDGTTVMRSHPRDVTIPLNKGMI